MLEYHHNLQGSQTEAGKQGGGVWLEYHHNLQGSQTVAIFIHFTSALEYHHNLQGSQTSNFEILSEPIYQVINQ